MRHIDARWMLLSLLLSGACFAGSAARATLEAMTTEKPGSPWHWVSESFGGGTALERELLGKPGRSVADDKLKADILKNIGTYEEKAGGTATPELLEVRLLPKQHDEYNEIWIVSRSGTRIVYTVTIKTAAQGGSDFRLQGPWE